MEWLKLQRKRNTEESTRSHDGFGLSTDLEKFCSINLTVTTVKSFLGL
jgi:hypothetical protein